MKNDIVLIGGGGHCRSCIDVIEEEGSFNIKGIIDQSSFIENNILGYPIIGNDDDLPISGVNYYFITVGQIESPEIRVKIYKHIESFKINLPVIISPYAYVSNHAKIGPGTIIMHGAIVNAGAVIGTNCIINTKALIEHDVQIGNFCHVSTAATLNGGVQLGNYSFIGSNSTINQMAKIPDNTVIGSGSVVTSNKKLSSSQTYWGNPLKSKHDEK